MAYCNMTEAFEITPTNMGFCYSFNPRKTFRLVGLNSVIQPNSGVYRGPRGQRRRLSPGGTFKLGGTVPNGAAKKEKFTVSKQKSKNLTKLNSVKQRRSGVPRGQRQKRKNSR